MARRGRPAVAGAVVGLGLLLGLMAWWAVRPVVAPGGPDDLKPAGLVRAPPLDVAAIADAGVRTLWGRVLTEDDQPVAGATVELVLAAEEPLLALRCGVCGEPAVACDDSDNAERLAQLVRAHGLTRTVSATAVTGADGAFRFPGVPAVPVEVRARTRELRGSASWAPDDEEQGAEASVTVLVRPAEVGPFGVASEDGEVVPGASVLLLDTVTLEVEEAVSRADGRVTPRRVRAPVWAYAEAEGFVSQGGWWTGVGDGLRLSRPHQLVVRLLVEGRPVEGEVTLRRRAHAIAQATRGGLVRFERLVASNVEVEARSGALLAGLRVVRLEGPTTELVLELRPRAQLTVKVVDLGGAPVPWASGVASDGEQSAEASSGEEARALAFTGLSQGDFRLEVEAAGYVRSRTHVRLGPGDNEVLLRLARSASIEGRVVDAQGAPVEGATVTARETLEGLDDPSAGTDEDGHFELELPEPGQWQLSAQKTEVGVGTVLAAAPGPPVTLRLDPGCGVRLRFVRAAGAFEDMWVGLQPRRVGVFHSLRTTDGGVAFLGLADQDYSVVAEGFSLRPSESVRPRCGQPADYVLTATEAAEISGLVVDRFGEPVSEAAVAIADRRTYTDSQGAFAFGGLVEGASYPLSLARDGEEEATAAAVRVQAPAAGVRLVAEVARPVRGRVLGAAGKPVREFEVNASTFVSAEGAFSARPQGGRLIVSATGFLTRQVPVADGAREVGEVVLQPAARATGTVVDRAGRPVAGARVSSPDFVEDALTDASGAFSAAVYRQDEELWEVAVVAQRGLDVGRARGSPRQPFSLTLEPPARVEGVVYGPGGRPVSTAVEVTDPEADAPSLQVSSDAQGRFELQLARGVYGFGTRDQRSLRLVAVDRDVVVVQLGLAQGTCRLEISGVGEADALHLLPGTVAGEEAEALLGDPTPGVVRPLVDAAGRARAEGLTCGPWTVAVLGGDQYRFFPLTLPADTGPLVVPLSR